MLKALIISPYHAQSHKSWAEGVVLMCPQFEWQILSLPPRHFNWRIRGNPLALLFEPSNATLLNDVDLLVATSMTDLATLKGLCPTLQNVPTVIYFHENQFAYPTTKDDAASRNLEAKLVTLYGALAADVVLFNSYFNQQTYVRGVRQMLSAFPDHAPQACVDLIEAKSRVLPVAVLHAGNGLERNFSATNARASSATNTHNPPKPQEKIEKLEQSRVLRIAWNHRWEYDKGPDRLAMVVEKAAEQSVDCEFSIVGQRFRKIPASFKALEDRFPQLIRHFGYVVDEGEYRDLLSQNDIVLSTALHDFQGLSVLEATRLGCIPLVPDRLAYAEYIPQEFRYRSYLHDANSEASEVVRWLQRYVMQFRQNTLPMPPDLERFSMVSLAPKYSAVFNALLANGT